MSAHAAARDASSKASEAERALRKAARDPKTDERDLARLASAFVKAHDWAEGCEAEARDRGERVRRTLFAIHRSRNGGRLHDAVAESVHETEGEAQAHLERKGTPEMGYHSPSEYGFIKAAEYVIVEGVAYPVESGTKLR